MKTLPIIIILLLTLTSCLKKEPLFDGKNCSGDCYVLSGEISEGQNNKPLNGVNLKFYFNSNNSFSRRDLLGNVLTSSDGLYNFKFDSKDYKDPNGYFSIEGSKEGYIYSSVKGDYGLSTFDLDSTKINVPIIKNLRLFKSSTLKIKVKATNVTNFLFLTVTYSYGTNGTGKVFNGGNKINEELVYKTASDIPTIISWDAVGNGVKIYRKDTIVVKSGTVGTYEINL